MFHAFSMKFFGFCMITILLKLVQSQRILEPVPVVQPPKPYNYGFQFGDGLGMSQFRQESADGTGEVKGSYGYMTLGATGMLSTMPVLMGTELSSKATSLD
ncbi:cuticle protein 16.8 [Trichonephila inaurata madagascariensis]|uniref:Cuticle protein 16.8 n=1 Tax=Trichonephila inaurata madagascariensis TaxID=2747483 RepID=A0A8X7CGS8_9ARAC|nr:cuticle protein 16.8 [Trichonephila inaurata madagascariensis]